MVKKVWTVELELKVRSDGVSAGTAAIVQQELIRVLSMIEDTSKEQGAGISGCKIKRILPKVARG